MTICIKKCEAYAILVILFDFMSIYLFMVKSIILMIYQGSSIESPIARIEATEQMHVIKKTP